MNVRRTTVAATPRDADKGSEEGRVTHERIAIDRNLRLRCPVSYSARRGGYWNVAKYADVRRVAGDARGFSSNRPFVGAGPVSMIPLSLDPPLHNGYRRLLNPFFSRSAVDDLEPLVRQHARDLLQPLLANGTGEMKSEWAYRLPVRVMGLFLGLPEKGWTTLEVLYERSLATLDGNGADEVNRVLESHIRQIVMRTSTEVGVESFVSDLLRASVNGTELDVDAVTQIVVHLLAGGLTTMGRALTICVHHLAKDRRLQVAVRRDATLLVSTIEELLRLEPPLYEMARTATSASEIAGSAIAAGDLVALNFASANRDGDVFIDADDFDPARRPNQHLSFGHGAHKCLGIWLARLELRAALAELLAVTEKFELAGVAVRSGGAGSGFASLPIRLTPH